MSASWHLNSHNKLVFGPLGSEYEPPKWKQAPDHEWIKELLADVEKFEERMAKPDGKDICIR